MFIAEVSSNHNNSLERCISFVEAAAGAGFDAIKFQAFKIDDLFAPEVVATSKTIRDRKAWEFPLEFLPEIKRACECHDIKLGITPFYLDAVPSCVQFVDFFKIASYELLWLPLLREVAGTGKPVIISSGMATLDEVRAALAAAFEAGGKDLEILHCVSNYPAPLESVNLSAIKTLKDELNVPIGWSDHTNTPEAVISAVLRWGAKTVEMHFDLDGAGEEFGPGHCWLPDQAASVIRICKHSLQMDGNGVKAPAETELEERDWRADPIDGLRPIAINRAKLKIPV